METSPATVWMACKQKWAPQPRWLRTDLDGVTPAINQTSPDRTSDACTGSAVERQLCASDVVYADRILIALCAACEANAAGDDELAMARIKTLYHMFEDIAH